MKKNIRYLLFGFFMLLFAYWWYHTYTHVRTIEMVHRNGLTETSYTIAPRYTKMIITNDIDTSYVFYNKNGKSVVVIGVDEIKNLEFINN